MTTFPDLTAFRSAEGQSFGPTEWVLITQEMINAFAKATLDFQWIHVDPERAKKESPFGTTIAHGFMSVSMASRFLEDTIRIESLKMGVNYGLDKVRFPHPVPVNSKIRMYTTIEKIEDFQVNGLKVFFDCKIEIEGVEKPACIAKFISLMME